MLNTSDIEVEKLKLRSVISDVDEAIIIADPNQNITIMNKAAEGITNFGSTEAIGKPIGEIIKLRENEENVSVDTFCPISGIDVDNVVFQKKGIQLATKEDKIKAVDVTSRRIKGGTKIGVGCIVVIDDKSPIAELERMKLDFVSMSVHVLRTPLSVLKGYLSFLGKEETIKKLDTNEVDYLNNSVTSVNDLINLVENLLDLVEIQKGSFNVETKPLDLDEAVNKVVTELKKEAEDKRLKIVYAKTPTNYPLVKADATRILMVLRNLIGNAVKFTEKGQVKVTVTDNKDGYMQVGIEDTGKGIPKENIPQLFERFYRVKEALEMSMGSGLGLYVSKKIIDEHNGEIWVESAVGKGSTFFFKLPVIA
jgi:PAS domain S-box-containing protein